MDVNHFNGGRNLFFCFGFLNDITESQIQFFLSHNKFL